VRAAMDHALKRARNGHGGSVLELVTYRLSDHTTADDARRYRDDAEVKAAWEREPMSRLRSFLISEGVWSEAEEAAWKEECGKKVDEEVNAYLETKVQPVEAMFDYLYAELPADIQAQREDAIKWEGR
jgi:2-oxoisovalerate dehydrogenase E1 component alpha subunit